tara:strand:- start:318 stop:632 length:315 start_codon:yes stop_codon:yes gene_type:complete
MKILLTLFLILLFNNSHVVAAEKLDCSQIKKISKNYLACKSGNLKKGIVNTGSKIKKTVKNKIKKKPKKVKKVTKITKKKKAITPGEFTKKIKNVFSKILKKDK